MASTVLVTGGAGFIGSHTVNRLIQDGHRVLVVDDLSTGKQENVNPAATFLKQDIANFDALSRVFQDAKPDYVLHLAAIPRMPVSIQDPVGTTRANVEGTVSVFKAAADSGVKRVVFASSSSVYGNQAKLPLKEDMYPAPISPYGLQKWQGEQFAQLFGSLYQLPVVSLRYFNVYGPRIDVGSEYSLVLGKFLRFRKEGKPLPITGDGKQTRAFCYVEDVVDANIKAMEAENLKGGEVMNIGSETSSSVQELAELIGGEIEYLPARPGDVLHTAADISLAKKLLGWEPTVSFAEGVKRTKAWFDNQVGENR